MSGSAQKDSAATKGIHPALEDFRVVHYLLYERDGKHVAHCLDLDLVCVGDTLGEAGRKLDDLVKAHIEYSLREGLEENLRTQAPAGYWRQFFHGKTIELEPRTIHIAIAAAGQLVSHESSESEVGIVARQPVHAA